MSTDSPLHLAIIPDGNRRWATRQRLKPWEGHRHALENSRALIDWCYDEPRIGTLTLWGFSTENWARSETEVAQLMRLFEDFLRREQLRFQEKQVRLTHCGRADRIPASLRDLLQTLARDTADHTAFTFNIALDYGGKDEILRAIGRAPAGALRTEEDLHRYLDHPELPDIDITIRTSGEQRMSNFFLWQGAYAEWFFLPLLYPELTPAHLASVLAEYDQRQRRFGH